jgi:endo-1,4-beta-xylanase
MVRDLKRRAVPIHGVGLQMHVALEAETRPTIGDLKANMKRLASVGVETHITEMDVRVPLPVSATDLERQAAVYNAITAACLAESGCTSITFWGFTDRHSWVSDSGAFPGNGAALLFDEAYQPKPAFEALQNAFMGA